MEVASIFGSLLQLIVRIEVRLPGTVPALTQEEIGHTLFLHLSAIIISVKPELQVLVGGLFLREIHCGMEKGCGLYSTCCELNNPPWFQTTLPQITFENIQLRLCNNGDSDNSDTVLNFLDIYVK